ncbi:hypothetical protein RhiJN_15253 [Ceratobasidium sp. AG-Ba]|nr:hypothetical protein RhiJN_15253 [Ceratobasidium sp. AG-Ba]
MNSPVIMVSHYRSGDRQMSVPGVQDLCYRIESCSLTAGWQPSFASSQRVPSNQQPIAGSLSDIQDLIDQHRNLVFEFTHPPTVDFRDLRAGELAGTQNSLIVYEYGQSLWNIMDSLQNMHVGPNESVTLKKAMQKVEASLGELRSWIEDQRQQQLSSENARA